MPFRSKEQIKKWGELVKQGKITKDQFQEAIKSTPNIKNLPQRVRKKRR